VAYPPEGVARLVSLVGPAHASELLFRANRIDAHEAQRIGLVNRVVPASRLEAEVREAALEMAERAPLSHAAHKLAVAAALRPESAELAAAAREAEARAWASEDCAEGRRAFAEKREPRFTGN
jgi:enoyl-CoA hydratase/carnithine racemase